MVWWRLSSPQPWRAFVSSGLCMAATPNLGARWEGEAEGCSMETQAFAKRGNLSMQNAYRCE